VGYDPIIPSPSPALRDDVPFDSPFFDFDSFCSLSPLSAAPKASTFGDLLPSSGFDLDDLDHFGTQPQPFDLHADPGATVTVSDGFGVAA
jgi:hypothetical protein